MTNAATARPASHRVLTQGQVVVGPDRYHDDGSGRRPYMVLQVHGDMAYVAELTHTRQGEWSTTELPTRDRSHSYLALVDFHTREWLPRWVPAHTCDRYRRQLSRPVREAALDAAARAYGHRR